MFKQMLQGFQRKTVPFTIVVGLFLLTCSFYEAIWQTPAAHLSPIVYRPFCLWPLPPAFGCTLLYLMNTACCIITCLCG